MSKYYDPVIGQIVEEFWDDSLKILTIKNTEDVEPLLDELAHERAMGNNGWSVERKWRKMGSIPNLEIERVMREEGIDMMSSTPEAKRRVRRYFADNIKFSTKG
jgi:hypothetical protein